MSENNVIGEFLLKEKAVTQEQLDQAIAIQKKSGGLLEMILVKQGAITPQNLTKYMRILEERGGKQAQAPRMRLGEILIQNNEITQDQLNQALEYQKQKGVKIGIALVELDLIERATLVKYLTKQSQMVIDAAGLSTYEASDMVSEAEKK